MAKRFDKHCVQQNIAYHVFLSVFHQTNSWKANKSGERFKIAKRFITRLPVCK